MQVKQSRFTLILLGIVAVGVLVLVVSLLLLQHQNSRTKKMRDEYAKLKSDYDARETQMRHLQDDIEKLDGLKARLAQLDHNLVAYRYVPSYLRQLQATTVRTNNMTRTIQPGELKPLDLTNSFFASTVAPGAEGTAAAATEATASETEEAAEGSASTSSTKASPYQVMSINLDVLGTYVSIVKLLDEFRKFPKMIYVKSIDLTPQKMNGRNMVSARIQTYAIITPDQYRTQDTQPAQPGDDSKGGGL